MRKSDPRLITINQDNGFSLLKQISGEVSLPLSDEDRNLVTDMLTFVSNNNGLGMAAIQFGIPKRMFVFKDTDSRGRFKIAINPVIHSMSGNQCHIEGCFSIPLPPLVGVMVKRPTDISVSYYDEHNVFYEHQHLSGSTAQIFLHEYAHLEGISIMEDSKYGKHVSITKVF